MKKLEPFCAADFDVTAVHEKRGIDINPRWYVTFKKRAVERHVDGRKKVGVGENILVGAGKTINDAIYNLIENADRMVDELSAVAMRSHIDRGMREADKREASKAGIDPVLGYM